MVSLGLESARRALARNPGLPGGFVAMSVALVWAEKDGATDILIWIPGTLLVIAMLVVLAVATPGGVIPGGKAGIIAIVSFGAFTAWCFLSISWADVRADAWSGANKTLAYFAIYMLLALRPWQTRPAAALLGFYSVGVAAIAAWTLINLDAGGDPRLQFISGRLIDPISYSNANAALFISAAIPALFLSSRRETPAVIRGVFLGAVVVLVAAALLCQSRMSLLATPLVLAMYFAFTPGRLRSLLSLAIASVAVAVSTGELLAVFTAVYGDETGIREVVETVDSAQRIALLSAIGAMVAGIAWGLIDQRIRLNPRLVRGFGVVAVVLVVAVGAAGSALFVDRYGEPVGRASIWWSKFKSDAYVSDAGTSHLVSGFGGAGRYAIWTVSYTIFEEHPIVGTGIDTFGVDWLRERPNTQDNVYPHSVELRILQQTGLVGTSLMLLFVVAALTGALRGIRRRSQAGRGVAISALLVFAYWGVHGSVDWLWEIPALAAAAFGFLGLAVALSPSVGAGSDAAPRAAWRRWATPVLVSAFALAALVTLVPPWLSARQVEAALRSVSEPTVAYDYFDQARALNPVSSEPDILASVVAEQAGDVVRQRAYLVRALSRNPYDWFAHLQIGLIDARRGDRELALRSVAKARALNPRDESIAFAEDRIRAGEPPTAEEMNERYVESAASCCRPD